METLFDITLHTLYIYLAFSVTYITLFAFASIRRERTVFRHSEHRNRFLILIPAYKEDRVIFDSVNSLLMNDYPKERYTITVISDKMESETDEKLSALGINIIPINPEKSSKATALKIAAGYHSGDLYDAVIILDADNVTCKNFLSSLNNAYQMLGTAIQVHRCAKNFETPMALLDAISEEINNSIFRKGHAALGLSSALIGSGMLFDYRWFLGNVHKLETAGEDKELELLLLKDRQFIEYLDHIKIYDEKVSLEKSYYNQRRRWLAAQFGSLYEGLKELPLAIRSLNIDLFDKIVQWMLLPRVIMMGVIFLLSLFLTFTHPLESVRWWILFVVLTLSLAVATPDYLISATTLKSLRRLPWIFLLTLLNFFRIRGVNRNFIHTQKG